MEEQKCMEESAELRLGPLPEMMADLFRPSSDRGLLACGVVFSRRRQETPDGRIFYVYGVLCGDEPLEVTDWGPGPPESVGIEVRMRVRVRAFLTRQGGPRYGLTLVRPEEGP